MKKSWASKSVRRSTNKYNCQSCKKTQEKNRRKLREVKKQLNVK